MLTSEILKCIADPQRLRILNLLMPVPCVCVTFRKYSMRRR